MFSVSFTRFVLKRSKAAKSSVSAGHALVGPGLGPVNSGAVEVPEDDQNDAGRGDVGQDAAVPAQDVQCGGLMYVVAVGVCNVADSDILINCMWFCCCCLRVGSPCSSRMPPLPLMISSSASGNPDQKSSRVSSTWSRQTKLVILRLTLDP